MVQRGDRLAYIHVINRFATLAAAQNVPDILSSPVEGSHPPYFVLVLKFRHKKTTIKWFKLSMVEREG